MKNRTIQLSITTRSQKRKRQVVNEVDNDSEFEYNICDFDTKKKVIFLHFKKNWLKRYLNEIKKK